MSRGFTAGYEPVAALRLGDPPRRAKLCDRNAHHAAEHRGILSGVGGHARGFRNPIDSFYPEWVVQRRNCESPEQIVRPLQGRHDWWSVLSGGGVPLRRTCHRLLSGRPSACGGTPLNPPLVKGGKPTSSSTDPTTRSPFRAIGCCFTA